MEIKDKIEILSKQIEVIHKKLFILLPTGAGSWFYGINFLKQNNIFLNIIAIMLFLFFIFIALGTFTNYIRLNKINKKLKGLEDGME